MAKKKTLTDILLGSTKFAYVCYPIFAMGNTILNNKPLFESMISKEVMYPTGIAMASYFIYEAIGKIYEIRDKSKEN